MMKSEKIYNQSIVRLNNLYLTIHEFLFDFDVLPHILNQQATKKRKKTKQKQKKQQKNKQTIIH